jgi:hypothetical protein
VSAGWVNLAICDSSHQGNEPAAAGDFKFAEDCVEVLFHHRQTQASVISDFLITPPFADKPRNFLFAPGELDKMRQTGARRPGTRSRAQIFAFDKKMRLRHAEVIAF